MKVRSDFVSNSSSSSFIVITSSKKVDLVNFIVKGVRPTGKPDRYGRIHEWDTWYDKENRAFLNNALANPPVLLLFGEFYKYATYDDDGCMKYIGGYIFDKDSVKSIVKNGEVLVTADDVIRGDLPGKMSYFYDTFEVTQDTIDFTRWFMSNCVDQRKDQDFIALNDFWANELTKEQRETGEGIPEDLLAKWNRLGDACKGKVTWSDPIEYKNGKDVVVPLADKLAKFEKALKAGKRIFRISFGYSGEGSDWSSYVWTDNFGFTKGNKDIKFESFDDM